MSAGFLHNHPEFPELIRIVAQQKGIDPALVHRRSLQCPLSGEVADKAGAGPGRAPTKGDKGGPFISVPVPRVTPRERSGGSPRPLRMWTAHHQLLKTAATRQKLPTRGVLRSLVIACLP